ncbi:MAG: tetratricopeptide (TPR) repeat protein [Flavobacteriaceae bacterium]|jgi:tetratricopeptide (TPR) repeat protein
MVNIDKKVSMDFILEGNFEEAMNVYNSLFKQDPTINKGNLNRLGYNFLNESNTKMTKDIFKVNMTLYPDCFNVFDRYAESCMKTGKTDLEILNYNKSLSLNPENNNATEMLKGLQKSK